MTAATLPLRCPKRGCTQHVDVVLDEQGGVDREYVKCLWHGEVRITPPPELDPPGMTRAGVPMRYGVKL